MRVYCSATSSGDIPSAHNCVACFGFRRNVKPLICEIVSSISAIGFEWRSCSTSCRPVAALSVQRYSALMLLLTHLVTNFAEPPVSVD